MLAVYINFNQITASLGHKCMKFSSPFVCEFTKVISTESDAPN